MNTSVTDQTKEYTLLDEIWNSDWRERFKVEFKDSLDSSTCLHQQFKDKDLVTGIACSCPRCSFKS